MTLAKVWKYASAVTQLSQVDIASTRFDFNHNGIESLTAPMLQERDALTGATLVIDTVTQASVETETGFTRLIDVYRADPIVVMLEQVATAHGTGKAGIAEVTLQLLHLANHKMKMSPSGERLFSDAFDVYVEGKLVNDVTVTWKQIRAPGRPLVRLVSKPESSSLTAEANDTVDIKCAPDTAEPAFDYPALPAGDVSSLPPTRGTSDTTNGTSSPGLGGTHQGGGAPSMVVRENAIEAVVIAVPGEQLTQAQKAQRKAAKTVRRKVHQQRPGLPKSEPTKPPMKGYHDTREGNTVKWTQTVAQLALSQSQWDSVCGAIKKKHPELMKRVKRSDAVACDNLGRDTPSFLLVAVRNGMSPTTLTLLVSAVQTVDQMRLATEASETIQAATRAREAADMQVKRMARTEQGARAVCRSRKGNHKERRFHSNERMRRRAEVDAVVRRRNLRHSAAQCKSAKRRTVPDPIRENVSPCGKVSGTMPGTKPPRLTAAWPRGRRSAPFVNRSDYHRHNGCTEADGWQLVHHPWVELSQRSKGNISIPESSGSWLEAGLGEGRYKRLGR